MDILGIGPMELIVILIVALVVLGPDRLPEIGSKLGRSLRSMRQATREFSREIETARQAIEAPLEEIRKPLQEAAKPLEAARTSAQNIALAAKAVTNPAATIRESVMRELRQPDKGSEPAATAASEAGSESTTAQPTAEPAPQDLAPGSPIEETKTPPQEMAPAAETATHPPETIRQPALQEPGLPEEGPGQALLVVPQPAAEAAATQPAAQPTEELAQGQAEPAPQDLRPVPPAGVPPASTQPAEADTARGPDEPASEE